MNETDFVRVEFDSTVRDSEHAITFSIDQCHDVAIDVAVTVQVVLFPAGGEAVTQTVPVAIYRFHKGE
jgi:hypothetical protein